MKKQKYRSLFISDLHIGTIKFRHDDFLKFIDGYEFEYIYLVGDIIDTLQLKYKKYWPQEHTNVIRKILKRSKNTKIYYIIGNHDEFLNNFYGIFGNIEFCEEKIHQTANGKSLLVIHGHQFDSVVHFSKTLTVLGDFGYEFLIYINSWLNKIRKFFGLKYWSLSGYVKNKIKNAIKFISGYENAVIKYSKNKNVDGLIVGHIHFPAIKEIDNIEYYNCGDWVENCTALLEDYNGKINLFKFEDGKV